MMITLESKKSSEHLLTQSGLCGIFTQKEWANRAKGFHIQHISEIDV